MRHPHVRHASGPKLSRIRFRTVILFSAVIISAAGGIAYAAGGASGGTSGALSPAKQAALNRLVKQGALNKAAAAQARIRAAAKVKTKPLALKVLPASGLPNHRTSGGLDTQVHSGPMNPTLFAVTDSWQGLVRGRWLYLVAGTITKNATGAVALYTMPVNPQDGSNPSLIGTYNEPGSAALTITAVKGNIATLKTTKGAHLTFNLLTHTFSRPQ
jgi:hypothetical protein